MKDKGTDKALVAIAIAVIAIMVAGEVVVYTSDYTSYSADASVGSDGKISYTISASGSKTYTAVSLDNGSHDVVSKLYIYYDESYKACYEDVYVAIGARELDQKYYVDQLAPTLRYRNINDVTVLNAAELAEKLEAEAASGSVKSGLICLSGALPDTVYTGSAGDAIFKWMSEGGSLYWAGNMIGKYSASQTELKEIDGYQTLFFETEGCLFDGESGVAYDEVKSNGFTKTLSLMNNNVRYGVDCSLLPEHRESLQLGFQSGGFSSISLISFGEGMMCIMGGDYSNNQRYDLAQVISSGLGPESEIVDSATGTVTRGSISGTLKASGENQYAFIYLGGYYPVYCRAISL